MTSLVYNEAGGITYAREVRIDGTENRSDILAELRLTIDWLGETCERQTRARANINKLLDMLQPGEATDALRAQLQTDMEKLDAVAKFRNHILEQVRGGSLKRLAELFDQ